MMQPNVAAGQVSFTQLEEMIMNHVHRKWGDTKGVNAFFRSVKHLLNNHVSSFLSMNQNQQRNAKNLKKLSRVMMMYIFIRLMVVWDGE